MITKDMDIKIMKKNLIIFSLALSLFAINSCNKAGVSYPNNLPWGGIDPVSAIIDGKSVAFGSKQYVPFVGYDEFAVTATETNADSTILRALIIRVPNGGGPINTYFPADKDNTNYQVKLTEIVSKKGDIQRIRSYGTAKIKPGMSIRLSENTSTNIKGIFEGVIKADNGQFDYIEIKGGYFNVTK
jgi:hypothetical protein